MVFTNVWAAGPLESAMSSPKFQEALMDALHCVDALHCGVRAPLA